jgi:hypothetical protein
MRMTGRGAGAGAALVPLILLTSACFDGGDYTGGGRRIEAPGRVDATGDRLDDATTTEDASPEDVDAGGQDDGAAGDVSFEAPRSEPPADVEDAGQGEAEGAPADVTSLDVRTEGPPSSVDAGEPRDAAVDVLIRDLPLEPRRD